MEMLKSCCHGKVVSVFYFFLITQQSPLIRSVIRADEICCWESWPACIVFVSESPITLYCSWNHGSLEPQRFALCISFALVLPASAFCCQIFSPDFFLQKCKRKRHLIWRSRGREICYYLSRRQNESTVQQPFRLLFCDAVAIATTQFLWNFALASPLEGIILWQSSSWSSSDSKPPYKRVLHFLQR